MDTPTSGGPTRRALLKGSAGLAAALTGSTASALYAGEDNTIRVALVGCGGRGTGATVNTLASRSAPTKLVAMADVFPGRLDNAHGVLSRSRYADRLEVPEERRFVGFDAYRKAIDCLRKGDLVLLATPPAFRWVHFAYAIEKGVHVFMEKPLAVDGPSAVRMLGLAAESAKKNLKVGGGLMCRHCEARQELFERIRRDLLGQILLFRAYRLAGPTGFDRCPKKPDGISELLYQIQRFHSFLWASGGAFVDFLIHNIDEACWMKDAWPVEASGSGGHAVRSHPKTGMERVDQNFDAYLAEFTFADGTRLMLEDRRMAGCRQKFATYAHGTKGAAVISESGHAPSHARYYKNQTLDGQPAWEFGPETFNPYQVQMDALLQAIVEDMKYNEAERSVKASVVALMGRKACHTGQTVTYEAMLKDEHDFAPGVEKLTLDSEAPLTADPAGRYPVPLPGQKGRREF